MKKLSFDNQHNKKVDELIDKVSEKKLRKQSMTTTKSNNINNKARFFIRCL